MRVSCGDLACGRLTQLCDRGVTRSTLIEIAKKSQYFNNGTKMRGIFLNTSPHKINAWEGGNGASG